jgi:hypothetical protein
MSQARGSASKYTAYASDAAGKTEAAAAPKATGAASSAGSKRKKRNQGKIPGNGAAVADEAERTANAVAAEAPTTGSSLSEGTGDEFTGTDACLSVFIAASIVIAVIRTVFPSVWRQLLFGNFGLW